MQLRPCVLLLATVLCACATASQTELAAVGLEVACSPGVDRDGDQLSDACELALARAFAPLLRVAAGACNRDGEHTDQRLAGEYLYGVQPVDGDTVRVVYLPAYHRDCGWSGRKCSLGIMDCRGHTGDSEVIALSVLPEGERWHTTAVYLSAHCFGRASTRCRWYVADELDGFEWAGTPRGAPVVWVAEGKNANYPSRAACDAGHWLFDTCDRNEVRLRYPVDPARNIGSAEHPLGASGCVTRGDLARRDPADTTAPVECVWSDVPFAGWQRPVQDPATPYVRYLRSLLR